MVYVMHETALCEPSYRYYTCIEDAYTRFGFDRAILEKALEDTISQEVNDYGTDA
jgi:hypothetical protein